MITPAVNALVTEIANKYYPTLADKLAVLVKQLHTKEDFKLAQDLFDQMKVHLYPTDASAPLFFINTYGGKRKTRRRLIR